MRAFITGLLFLLTVLAATTANAQTMQPAQAITVTASSTNITTSAYLELDSAMDAACTYLAIYNSTASVLYLATGASSSEARIKYDIPPASGMFQIVHLPLPKGVRLSARAVGANATTGNLVVNCLQ